MSSSPVPPFEPLKTMWESLSEQREKDDAEKEEQERKKGITARHTFKEMVEIGVMLEVIKMKKGNEQADIETRLREFGYTKGPMIGRGNTREVFEATFREGPLQKTHVVKIPLVDEYVSPTTAINLAKGDPDVREVLAVNQIRHPNSIEVYRAFPWQGRTVTIEEHFNACSLEELVQREGPLKDRERFAKIFGQTIDGLEYLHRSCEILHRDIKPSNILVGKPGPTKDMVKIDDFQNAAEMQKVRKSLFPTRGGTAYTPPEMLNAFMEGKETSASLASELYALGATMYFALTEKTIRDVALVENDREEGQKIEGKVEKEKIGRIVRYGDQEATLALSIDGTLVDRIDEKEHRAIVAGKIQKLPRRWRKLLTYCLDYAQHQAAIENQENHQSAEQLYRDLHHYFAEATDSGFWERVKSIPATIWNASTRTKTLGLLAIGAIGAVGVGEAHFAEQRRQAHLEELVTTAEKLKVSGCWNFNLEIENNHHELMIWANGDDPRSHYNAGKQREAYYYIEDPENPRNDNGGLNLKKIDTYYLLSQAGHKISVNVQLKSKVTDERVSDNFAIKAYLEGYPSHDTTIWSEPLNSLTWDAWEAGVHSAGLEILVPEGFRDGVYNLAVEVYPSKDHESSYSRFDNPHHAVSRKIIPVVVGNPENKIALNRLTLGDGYTSLSFESLVQDRWRLHDQVPQDTVCEIVIPSVGVAEVQDKLKHNYRFLGITALEEAAPGDYDVCFRIIKGEQIVSQTYVPIRKVEDPKPYPRIEYGPVDEGFAERIEELRVGLPVIGRNEKKKEKQ